MPAVAKISDEDVVAAARSLIEKGGLAALSMQAVAERVGVRAPSLYKRFNDRRDLLAAVEAELLGELGQLLEQAGRKTDADGDLRHLARAYRAFARARPRLYELLYGPEQSRTEETTELRRAAARPVIDRLVARVGPDRALPAARALTAFLHGFVSMEIQGAFHLGGDVAAAFELGLEVLVTGLVKAPAKARAR